MYYEFYLDVYFLENLIMNCLVLYMAGRVQKDTPASGRILFSGVLGAALDCVMIVLPIHRNAISSLVCNVLIWIAMTFAGYGRRRKQVLLQKILIIVEFSFVLGGVWQLLRVGLSLPFIVAIPGGYVLVYFLWNCWRSMQSRTQYIYDVTLQRGKKEIHLKGLLDSGNRLVQPITAKPVHIADFKEIKELLDVDEIKELNGLLNLETEKEASGKFMYIPYHSIGKSEGVLPAITLDSISIKHGESARSTKGVLIAVSKTAVSSEGEYQMILHPRILE